MEKETVLVLLLLKPMTKTSQLNVYGNYVIPWWVPCDINKYQFLDFCHYFDENHVKDMKIKKEIVLLLKPMTKTSQVNGNPRKMFSDSYSVPNSLSRWRLQGVFS